MPSKPRPFTFTELQTVTSLGRGEIRECINRGIISAPASVGQGNRRAYTKWNLVEGVIAASLLRQVRAGAVAHAMTRLRSMLEHLHIDPEDYCEAVTRKGRRCRNPMAYTQVHGWDAEDGGWADDVIDRQCLVQRRCRTHVDRTIPPPRVWVQFVPCGRWAP